MRHGVESGGRKCLTRIRGCGTRWAMSEKVPTSPISPKVPTSPLCLQVPTSPLCLLDECTLNSWEHQSDNETKHSQRHSRESGNPEGLDIITILDTRFPGYAGFLKRAMQTKTQKGYTQHTWPFVYTVPGKTKEELFNPACPVKSCLLLFNSGQ